MAYDSVRGQILLFGGIGESGTLPRGDTWAWDGSAWRLLANSGPSARIWASAATDSARGRVVLFGGSPYAENPLTDTWEWDGSAWLQRATTAAPSPRAGMAMAYDSARGRIVAFGGENYSPGIIYFYDDTWEYDGTDWVRLDPAGPIPGARSNGRMAFDPVRQRTVLFGGGGAAPHYNDTWEWNGANWTPVATPTAPSERAYIAMAFDPSLSRVVLHGGDIAADDGETWIYDGADWSPLASGVPSERYRHNMAYDEARGRMVLFGGRLVDESATLSDTYELDPAALAWLDRTPATPGPRGYGAASFDGARTIYFGGVIQAPGGARPATSETWGWDAAGWSLLATTGPAAQAYIPMAYDSDRGRVVALANSAVTAGQTWEWYAGTWHLVPIAGPATGKEGVLAYDPVRQRTVFQSYSAGSGRTYEYDGVSWSLVSTGGPMTGIESGMCYDTDRGVMVAVVCSSVSNQTWERAGTVWSLVASTGPAPRCGFDLVYDPDRQRTLLFGGSDGPTFCADTWEWDGVAWNSIPVPGPGPVAEFAASWNPSVHRTVLFGGVTADNSLSSRTWLYGGSIVFTGQPGSLTIDAGQNAAFSVSAYGAGPVTFRWRKDGNDLADGPTGTGASISGADKAVLSITAAGPADAGAYECLVSADCGSSLSNAAVLMVNSGCPADLNGDGLVDFSDYLEFLNLYDANDPRADFNQDGLVDFSDYLEFLNFYDAGC